MTNEHNFKVGDRVYVAYDPTISAIVTDVCHEAKYDYYVKENGSEFTTGCHEYELLDAKTAFLTRLQSLLREFEARINDHDGYKLYIDFGIHGEGSERIVYSDTEGEITADNIMDFDKE